MLAGPAKRAERHVRPPGVARQCQFSPPSVVVATCPLSPTTHPLIGSKKEMAFHGWKNNGGSGRLIHVSPASVVLSIEPSRPAAIAVTESRVTISASAVLVPLFCWTHCPCRENVLTITRIVNACVFRIGCLASSSFCLVGLICNGVVGAGSAEGVSTRVQSGGLMADKAIVQVEVREMYLPASALSISRFASVIFLSFLLLKTVSVSRVRFSSVLLPLSWSISGDSFLLR